MQAPSFSTIAGLGTATTGLVLGALRCTKKQGFWSAPVAALLALGSISLGAQLLLKEYKKVTRIILVRHGQTPRNEEGKEIQGRTNDLKAQLNHKGKQQAWDVGRLLAKIYGKKINTIVSSPLTRCVNTAEIIADRLGISHSSIQIDPRFSEISHGVNDMMDFQVRKTYCMARYAEREAKYKSDHQHKPLGRFFKWKYNPLEERTSNRPVDSSTEPLETVYQVFERATEGLKDIARKYPGQTVVVSTHAGLISTVTHEAEMRQKGDLSSVLRVYYEKDSSKDAEKAKSVLPVNCSAHTFEVRGDDITFLHVESVEDGTL